MPDEPFGRLEPPARADALLEWTLPEGAKGLTILGDLHEEFRDMAARHGERHARRWYWRASVDLGMRYGAQRLARATTNVDGRGGETVGSLMKDLRFGVRMLMRTPGLSAIAVLTIAFGVGLTTHTYSSVLGAVVRGLPVPGSDRLVVVQEFDRERGTEGDMPYRQYLDLLDRSSGMESLAGVYDGTINLSGDDGPPERFQGAFVTANALQVLGVLPILGRVFEAGEDGPDVERRLVLSFHVWQARFAGDPGVVGRVVRANGEAAEIVGVMPDGFRFPFDSDMWLTHAYEPDPLVRRSQYLTVFGRTPEGVELEVAGTALAGVASGLAETYPEDNAGIELTVKPFAERYMPSQITAVLWLMLAATFGVLMIACANVANLLLARASLRTREVAIRTAMGASRFRVMRQLFAEAVVIALVGGIIGVFIAWGGVVLFNDAIADIQKPYWIDVYLDVQALAFALGVTLLSSIAAGVYPALKASGVGMGDTLRDESRGSSGLRAGRFSNVLVISEIAVSCGLLIVAGLMIKSVANLKTVDLGFEPESVLTGRIGIFASEYPTEDARRTFFEQLEDRLEALPGVESAALATSLPGLGGSRWPITVEGDSYTSPRDHSVVNGNLITSDFFESVGTALLQGRDFTPGETWDASESLAIVNESFVRTVLGGREPIGMRVKIGEAGAPNPFARIIGVVPDMHVGGGVGGIGDDRINPEHMYVGPGAYDLRFMSAVLRTAGPPEALVPDLRREVSELDSTVPVYNVASLDRAIDEATWAFGLFGSLFTIFGFSALFLAAVGLYGVMAFSVTQRRQELGVRMALGAGPDRILRMVLGKGLVQLFIGVGIGLLIGFGLSRPLSVVTFGVEASDPVVYGAIVLTLSLAGLVASLVPARAATRADPVEAMRP